MQKQELTEQQRKNLRKYFSAQQIAEPSDNEIDRMASILQYPVAPLTDAEWAKLGRGINAYTNKTRFAIDEIFAKRNAPDQMTALASEPPAGYVRIEDVRKAAADSIYMRGTREEFVEEVISRLQSPKKPTLRERIENCIDPYFVENVPGDMLDAIMKEIEEMRRTQ